MTDGINTPKPGRLLSLDIFRGMAMFLLTIEGTGLYIHLLDLDTGKLFDGFVQQFTHHPWNGLRFWDLIEPYFMFIVGVAMPFSYFNRLKKGIPRRKITLHIIQRCAILFVLGLILYCGFSQKLVFELWNVLTQLAFTIIVAYIFMHKRIRVQLGISLLCLLINDFLYRFSGIDGYSQPFTIHENFGSFMDMVMMGKIEPDGWVAFNAVPTSAFTIWGVITGRILMNSWDANRKIRVFTIAGILMIIPGLILEFSGISPVIKHICTTSYMLIAGGITILSLTFFYWLVDIKKISRWGYIFVIFGMNPIFIYMLSGTVVTLWFNEYVLIFVRGLEVLDFSDNAILVTGSILVFLLEMVLLQYMYKHRIFIKI